MKNLFAVRLTDLLKENNLSKRGFAEKIGVSAMSISDWTNGKVQPTAENIYIIAVYFDVTADYLLGLEDETGAKVHQNF
ncbi:MAG: helix-turn-helix transcriptional regulator [Clostridiales bacterium]|nr:helix-turn-helix transcriptional regulator [Clostridiales bacterium]